MRRWLRGTLWVSLSAFLVSALVVVVLWFGVAIVLLAPVMFVLSLLGSGSGSSDGRGLVGPFLIFAAAFVVTGLASLSCVQFTVKLFRSATRFLTAKEIAQQRAAGLAANAYIHETYLPVLGVLLSLFTGIAIGVTTCALITIAIWREANPQRADERAQPSSLPHTDPAAVELRDRWMPAAERGEAYAQFVVGEAYANGLMGLTHNTPLAREWLKKSAAKNDADAKLSLIIAERTDSLGNRQHFDNDHKFVSYAEQYPGWRAAAVYMMLADSSRKAPGDPNAAEQNYREWLRKAAQNGSRYAAFRLGRALEPKYGAKGKMTSDFSQAAVWYQTAGAYADILRLEPDVETKLEPPAVRVDTRSASAEECDRLKHRVAMVDQRSQTLRAVDMRSYDAWAHRTIYADACENFREAAEYFASSDNAAIMYYELAARQGDVSSMLKVADRSFTLGLGQVQAVIYAYKWYALAIESLVGKDDAASNLLRDAAEAGYNKARATLFGPAREEAEAALAVLREQSKR